MTDDQAPHPVLPWLTPERRIWLYTVAVALAALAVGYELLTEARAMLWVGLAAAVLGNVTAIAHVPKQD